MKLVGADSGHYQQEEFVEEVLLAPSERVAVDALFGEPGELTLEHRTPNTPTNSPRSPSAPTPRGRTSLSSSTVSEPTPTWPPSGSGYSPT